MSNPSEPTEAIPIRSVVGFGADPLGAFIDVIVFGNDKVRVSFPPELGPHLNAAIQTALGLAEAERQKTSPTVGMRPTSVLDVTKFSMAQMFDPGFVAFRLDTHQNTKLPFRLTLEMARELAQSLMRAVNDDADRRNAH